MSADVARGHGGDCGGDDRPPPHHSAGDCREDAYFPGTNKDTTDNATSSDEDTIQESESPNSKAKYVPPRQRGREKCDMEADHNVVKADKLETKRILLDILKEKHQKSAEAGTIPSFYKKKPEDGSISHKVQRLAKYRFLKVTIFIFSAVTFVISVLLALKAKKKLLILWFSRTSAQRICDVFLALDKDMNGTLSKHELQEYADGTLTYIFIERAFDEHLRRGKSGNANAWDMDFESFLDFVLALENKDSPEGNTVRRAGKLVGLGKTERRNLYNGEAADPLRITLSDLLSCKQGGTVASMLIDVCGFWAHDNRENLLQEEEEPEEE
ncbi:probable serine/threonine-protein phosphatase 2A regulatory subunit B'' subunit TON2 [Tanacetum coccineum]